MVESHRTMPTREQLRIWRDYVETSEVIRTRLGSRMQTESSLSAGDYGVLLALTEAPQHTLRSSQLARLVGWERSRLSHHLGRMEKRHLIRRVPCVDDVHGVDVIATEHG
ncbi:MarR family transcriptional regulator, partial [Nakamurella silvestris]